MITFRPKQFLILDIFIKSICFIKGHKFIFSRVIDTGKEMFLSPHYECSRCNKHQ